MISGSDDTSIKFWDAETGTELAKITDHTGMINKVRYDPTGSVIASCSTDKKVKIFDSRSQRLL